jgi:hypothetical protein
MYMYTEDRKKKEPEGALVLGSGGVELDQR